ncbi:hypothetical protein EDB89DRAFT_2076864 [Lactarius sanguifluus]|nr:hypothetical protein EDB89DRAFT_2076864 [Lactarius sanguifluus]
MPISSDFEHLLSATVDQPTPMLSSTPPSLSLISPTFMHSATEHQSEPEPAPTLLPSIPTLPITPSHVHSAINNLASTPLSSSSISSTFLPSPVSMRSAMNYQPEPESVLASECLIPPSNDVPEITSTPHSSSSVLLTNLECVPLAMVDRHEFKPEHTFLSSITPTPSLPAPSLALEFSDDVPELSSPSPTPLSTSLAFSEYSTSLSSPTKPPPSETPTSMPSDMRSDPHSVPTHSSPPLRSSSGDSSDTVVELVVVPVSLNSSELSLSLGEPVPFLPTSLELILPHPTTSQRPPGLKTLGSDSSLLEVTPPLASSVPQQSQEPSLVYGTSLALVLRPTLFHSSGSLRRPPARFGFALALVTTAILSSLLNVSKALSVHSRKVWSKYEDFGNNQNGNLKTSKPRNILAQRLRLGQLTPRAARFVFDPGGPASSFKLLSAHEDVRKRKSKTRIGFITMRSATLLTPILDNNLIVFNPGVAFVLEPAHEDSATLDEDAR